MVYTGPAVCFLHLLPHRPVQILAPLTCLNHAPLCQANTPHPTLGSISQPGAPSTSQVPCLSLWNDGSILPPHPLPPPSFSWVLCIRSLLFTSLSLPVSPSPPPSHLNSSLCRALSPVPSLSCLVTSFLPPLSAWPFLQGSLHLAHLSLPSSLRVSGAAQDASAPAPALPLLSLLLFWKVQSPSGRQGRRVCAVSFCC